MRAIEIATYSGKKTGEKMEKLDFSDLLMVGLKVDKENLEKKINKRVSLRLKQGFEKEVKDLLNAGVSFDDQSMQAMGYRQYEDFVEKKISKEEFINNWVKAEGDYAKRQMVWFKKEKRITWFEILGQNYPENVIELVERWLRS